MNNCKSKFKHNFLIISSENKMYIRINLLRWKVKETIGVAIINPKGVAKGRLKEIKHIDIEEDIIRNEN